MKTEAVIVGGGPGGAACAMYLIRQGIKPIIVEKQVFPRYHIGESMTGTGGALVRDLGFEDQMAAAGHQVKHGVKVFGKHSWFVPVMARSPEGELVDQTTYQVRRSHFDKMMLDEAVARGATLIQGNATKPIMKDDAVAGVEVRLSDGGMVRIESEVVLDCSGQATFLAAAGVTGPKYMGSYDKQVAIFSQVEGGIRDSGGSRDTQPGNTLIFYKAKYHWAWWIPIDDETVSVGVVSPSAYFKAHSESRADYLTRELGELHPELSRRLPEVKLVEATRPFPNYSYQVRDFCGKGYVCIGDAHRFIDPIFSFGLFATMQEAQFVAPVVKAYLEGANRDAPNPFAAYQLHCEQGMDMLEDMIDCFWEKPLSFALLVHQRYRPDMIDVFAGRVYDKQPYPLIREFRKLLKRERLYDQDQSDFSIPIGSRYHPERAPIWEDEEAELSLD
jgi:flavin-dependent dehydrogenase